MALTIAAFNRKAPIVYVMIRLYIWVLKHDSYNIILYWNLQHSGWCRLELPCSADVDVVSLMPHQLRHLNTLCRCWANVNSLRGLTPFGRFRMSILSKRKRKLVDIRACLGWYYTLRYWLIRMWFSSRTDRLFLAISDIKSIIDTLTFSKTTHLG